MNINYEWLLGWVGDRLGHEPSEERLAELINILGSPPAAVLRSERALWRWCDEQLADRRRWDVLVAAVTNNESAFFREAQFYDFFTAELEKRMKAGRTPVRVLSAACSAGQELYSCAITAMQKTNRPLSQVVKLYGVDIDRVALKRAGRGRFRPWDLRILTSDLRQKYFTENGDGQFTLDNGVCRAATFRRRNILSPWLPGLHGAFDVVLVRNVFVHLTPEARMRATAVLAPLVSPGGVLVLAASEVGNVSPPGFDCEEFEGFFYLRRETMPGDSGLTLAFMKAELPVELLLGAPSEEVNQPPADAWVTAALGRFNEGDFGGALAWCAACRREVPKLSREDEGALSTIEGLVHLAEGAIERARARLERGVSMAPQSFVATYFLGEACRVGFDDRAACKAYEQALSAIQQANLSELDIAFFDDYLPTQAASVCMGRIAQCGGRL